jgi:hypothetical protein
MSDFGLMLSFYRKDGKSITQQEYKGMENQITSLFYDQDITNYTGEEFHPQALEAINEQGMKGVSFIISEYWDEDGEMQEDESEEILDYDESQVEELVMELQALYDEHFEYEFYKGHW